MGEETEYVFDVQDCFRHGRGRDFRLGCRFLLHAGAAYPPYQLDVGGMGGPRPEDLGPERRAEQGQVADQVEGFVPARLVVEPQGPGAHDSVLADHHPVLHAEEVLQLVQFLLGQVHVGDDDRTLQAAALDQSPFAQDFDVTQEGPGPRGREIGDEFVFQRVEHRVLAGEVGFLVIDHVGEMEIVGGHDDEFLQQAVFPFRVKHRVIQLQVFPGSVLFDDTGFQQRGYEGHRTAVANRRLRTVEFDSEVVHAQSRHGGQDVFDGVYPDAVARQVRPPGRVYHVIDIGRDFHPVGMVDTNKPDPVVDGTRLERQRRFPSGMQTDPLHGRGGFYGTLMLAHLNAAFSLVPVFTSARKRLLPLSGAIVASYPVPRVDRNPIRGLPVT